MSLHADRSQRIVVRPGDRLWSEREEGGSLCRLESLPGLMESGFLRLPAGASLNAASLDREVLICSGSIEIGERLWGSGSYLRIPGDEGISGRAGDEALLFVKTGRFPEGDRQWLGIATEGARFSPGLVPGLSVFPLFSGGTANTAFVRWAPGTVFQPHRHLGGEEILVLSGTFEDEHGAYPAGSWYRAPHMSHHHPFSREGCLIFVKTGHLLESSAA